MAAEVVAFRPDDTESVKRMDSIKNAAKWYGVPEHFIRTLALEGKIPAVRAGSKKIWINMDGLAAYLSESHV